MRQKRAIQRARNLKLKRIVTFGGCLLLCAGMSACGKGDGDLAWSPDEQTGKMMEATKETEIPEDTAVKENEVSADVKEERTGPSSGYWIQDQTFYNADLGFLWTIPNDWVVESDQYIASLGDDVHFFWAYER